MRENPANRLRLHAERKRLRGGLAKQRHPDLIAIADHPIDIHGVASRRIIPFPDGPFGIPYRCLRPAGVKNLLVASRSAGFSHIAASAVRCTHADHTRASRGQCGGPCRPTANLRLRG